MAYIEQTNTIALEIAKSGSRTLVYAAEQAAGTRHLRAAGHHDIGTSINKAGCTNPTVIAVIRDPAKRLVSAINFHFTGQEHTIDTALDLCVRNGGGFNSVFQRQTDFLKHNNEPHKIKLFPMERMADAVRAIGFTGDTPHRNKRPYRWSAEQLTSHPLWGEILDYYAPDMRLRETLVQ